MGFQQGVSGLAAAAKALDVTGNNIANSATVGFKASRTNFADVYAASMLAGGTGQTGLGASVSNIQQLFTQGSKTTTSNSLDLAISGGGFYKLGKVLDSFGNTSGAETYTRNGQFHLNGDGFIVNDQNLALIGVQASATGIVPTTIKDTDLGPINVTNSVGNPKATSTSTIKANLNSLATSNATFDINNTETLNTANFSRGMDVYDSEGNSHSLDYYFVKTATTNQWQVYGTVTDVYNDTSAAPAPGTTLVIPNAAGTQNIEDYVRTTTNNPITLQFSTNGVLQSLSGDAGVYTYNAANVPPDFTDPAGTTVSVEAVSKLFSFNFDGTSLNGTIGQKVSTLSVAMDFSNLTQFSSPSTVDKLSQDGYPKGKLSGLDIDETGLIQAQYDNGKTSNVGRIVLYSFVNPNALMNLGNNQWGETAAAGKSYSYAGEGNLGTIQSYATEDSNVDLTQELVNLITEQRNYQANAQTIKTQDQIMQTLVNLK